MAEPLRLKTLLETRPSIMPLKNREVTSPLIHLEFDDIKLAHDHFKPFVRELKYDTGELAIVTYLQALAYHKELVLMPFVVAGNFHHKSIGYNTEKGDLTPGQLTGKRVGVRSYAQTTGVWVRGVLKHEYGVDLDKVTWVTFVDGHLAEYTDPPNCERAPAGKKLVDMLLNREVDAAILGMDMPDDPRLKRLIPNPEAAQEAWYKKNGFVPINHMWVIKKSIVKERPDVVKELYRMLVETKKRALKPGAVDLTPCGVEANRKALEFTIEYALEQKIIPRRFSVDELFDDTTRALG